jgi:hypothetical protein
MHHVRTYLIRLGGQVKENEINAGSPLHLTVVRADPTTTLLSVGTDQSGLVGLVRHLHGLGFVLLSVTHNERGDDTLPPGSRSPGIASDHGNRL